MNSTVILDSVMRALENRNRERDAETAEWWAAFLHSNAEILLEEKEDESDDDG